MNFRGDETDLDETKFGDELAQTTVDILRKAAAGDGYRQVREARLQETMEVACTYASTMGHTETDRGRRMGAAAALMLVQNSPNIFADYPRLPEKAPELYGSSYLVGAAWLLAESVAEALTPPESRPPTNNVVARGQLVRAVEDVVSTHQQIVGDRAEHTRGTWWAASFNRLTQALGAYHTETENLIEQQRSQLEALLEGEDGVVAAPHRPDASARSDEAAGAASVDEVTALAGTAHPGLPSITDTPVRAPQSTSVGGEHPPSPTPPFPEHRRGRLIAITAGVTVLATTIVLFGVGTIFPGVPRAVLEFAQPGPPPPVLTPQVLPNTDVQVFLLGDDKNIDVANQTISGKLPTAPGPVVPQLYDDLSFQVWLSVRDDDDEPDAGLQLSIGATAPMTVKNSFLMRDAHLEGDRQTKLDTQPNGSAGSAVDVPPLVVGQTTIYQFEVEAHPEDNSNGYMCGYNAKAVQVLVRRKGGSPDDRVYVATPYPLYVVRGKDC